MRFFLNEKRISKAKAATLLSKKQRAEAAECLKKDPYVCMSYMTAEGIVRIELS